MLPVDRRRHAVVGRQLQRVDYPQNLYTYGQRSSPCCWLPYFAIDMVSVCASRSWCEACAQVSLTKALYGAHVPTLLISSKFSDLVTVHGDQHTSAKLRPVVAG